MREEVIKHQQVIHKYLGRYGTIAANEAPELEQAYREMRSIQNKCFHQFLRAQLFTSDGLVCESCGVVKSLSAEDGDAEAELKRA